jgi:hypothetical protein
MFRILNAVFEILGTLQIVSLILSAIAGNKNVIPFIFLFFALLRDIHSTALHLSESFGDNIEKRFGEEEETVADCSNRT